MTNFSKLLPALLLIALPAVAAEKQKVLITTFDPFDGSKENNSQPIGELLRAHPEWINGDAQVVVCNLPVVYGEAPKKALECIEKEKPNLVVSLGEAGCTLRIESAGNNLDNAGIADNAGVKKKNQKIVKKGPERLGLPFPVDAAFCALQAKDPEHIEPSITPGNFVCNNVTYSLALKIENTHLPFTFIHVPNSECVAEKKNPERNAKLIAAAIDAGQKRMASDDKEIDQIWRRLSKGKKRMPTSAKEVEKILAQLEKKKAPECEIQYAQALKKRYEEALAKAKEPKKPKKI